ncbi:MAG TPA: GTPase Era, partial [Saprospiraceae bacterium]|nr:GTPase Era [Saprospiraceae bacterium]
MGLVNGLDFQIVLSDTPGYIEQAAYPLQDVMNLQVKHAFEDADVILFVVDASNPHPLPEHFFERLHHATMPIILCLNKIDRDHLSRADDIQSRLETKGLRFHSVHRLSALQKTGIEALLEDIKSLLPEHPAYFPDDILSNRPVRFFISEMIREQIYQLYEAEIPYHCFVVIEQCKGVDEGSDMAIIDAIVYVGKQSHVPILIGKGGSRLKELGIRSRTEIEKYLNQKVYLNLSIKLRKDWRDNPSFLNKSSIFQ